jgi:hypothetical protein
MSTPDFLPQNDTNFTDVRFYTALDPYFYTVDNRPLEDLQTNIKAARTGGGDSGRRATASLALNLAEVMSEMFTAQNQTTAISGLQVYRTGANAARVGPGAYYELRNISATVTHQVLKQALVTANTDFAITAPVGAGTSLVYTVEGQFYELNDTTMPATQLPYMDASNIYLPSTLVHGELRLTLLSGTAATTGTEVPAATTAGKFPLYNITIAQGSNTFKVELHANAPRPKALARNVTATPLPSGGTTAGTVNEMVMQTFVNASTTGVMLPSVLHENNVSPYMPIKVKMTFTSTVTGGAASFRLRYKAFSAAELTSVAGTTTALDNISISAAANGVQTYTTVVSVPPSEFAGFVSTAWVVNKEYLNVIVERVGGDSLDTNTGSTQVLSFALVQ